MKSVEMPLTIVNRRTHGVCVSGEAGKARHSYNAPPIPLFEAASRIDFAGFGYSTPDGFITWSMTLLDVGVQRTVLGSLVKIKFWRYP